jgi:purine-binding chemotaxis protein CheW
MSDMIHLPPSGLAEDILGNEAAKPNEAHVVTFNLGEEYGVPISQVYEIIRPSSITAVPNSPDYIEGVINIRGKVLPVLNLRKRLNLETRDITKDSRIVVTEVNNKVIGLLVDAVSQVMKIPAEFIESAPEEVLEISTDYITGVGKLEEQLVILLDLERLLKRENIEIKESEKVDTEN